MPPESGLSDIPITHLRRHLVSTIRWPIRNHTMNSSNLASIYFNILSDIDISLLDRSPAVSKTSHNISGIFLPSLPENFHQAKRRTMIVGCETKAWSVLKNDERFVDLSSYIARAVTKHKVFFEEQLKKKNSRGCTFHNFTRSVATECGKDGLIYANLFCFSWKNGSPLKSPYFETIKKYSGPLLKAQISFFKPDTIIFANGINTAPYRRKLFPIDGENSVCKNSRDYSKQGISKHQLWEFDLYDGIRCFRIHHPSAQGKDAAEARKFLLGLLAV